MKINKNTVKDHHYENNYPKNKQRPVVNDRKKLYITLFFHSNICELYRQNIFSVLMVYVEKLNH